MSGAGRQLYHLSVHPRIDFDPRLLLVVSLAIPVLCLITGLWIGIPLGLIPVFVLAIAWSVRRDTWLALDDDALVLHMGWIFHHRLPLSEIDSADAAEHRYLKGLGARRLGPGTLGVILDTRNVVSIRLRRPVTFRVFPLLRVRAETIKTNPTERARFLADLQRRLDDRRAPVPPGASRATARAGETR